MLFYNLKNLEIDTRDPIWINACRLYCYGFRTGGYWDVIKQKIEEIDCTKFSKKQISCVWKLITEINELIGLRAEPIPTN